MVAMLLMQLLQPSCQVERRDGVACGGESKFGVDIALLGGDVPSRQRLVFPRFDNAIT